MKNDVNLLIHLYLTAPVEVQFFMLLVGWGALIFVCLEGILLSDFDAEISTQHPTKFCLIGCTLIDLRVTPEHSNDQDCTLATINGAPQ